ncbi:MAG: redox-sensing transcriptional repressor Rex [candidate division WOR-3 bacterium]
MPEEVVRRLYIYAQCLENFLEEEKKNFSSEDIANKLNIKASLVRKDFSYIGSMGKRGVGYNTEEVLKIIKKIAFPGKEIKVALIGVGKLGSALLNFYGFKTQGLRIALAFDKDKRKIGNVVGGVKIEPMDDFEEKVKKEEIKIAIVAVPAEEALNVMRKIKKSSIKAVLNFTPSYFSSLKEFSDGLIIRNIDLSSELAQLSYYLLEKGKRKSLS